MQRRKEGDEQNGGETDDKMYMGLKTREKSGEGDKDRGKDGIRRERRET